MRSSFIQALEKHSTANTILITGDLGFGVLDSFSSRFPERYINAGVAEQNMTGIAAGLALEGKQVFTYSIANFNTLRAVEQIRNDIAYHDLDVVIVAVGGGMAYGQLGISHHATEDLAILRSIPGLRVFAPGDTREAYELTRRLILDKGGPAYLRLGRAGEATLHSDKSIREFCPGKILPLVLKVRSRVALLSTGGMLEVANSVADALALENIETSVFSVHTLKPFDNQGVIDIFKNHEYICALEEHSIIGGLNGAIAESLIGVNGIRMENFIPFALPVEFTYKVGDQDYLREHYGLSANQIVKKVKSIFK